MKGPGDPFLYHTALANRPQRSVAGHGPVNHFHEYWYSRARANGPEEKLEVGQGP